MEKIWFKEYEAIRLQAGEPNLKDLMQRALVICDDALGEGLYTEERLSALCRKENHYFHCVVKGDSMVGIFYCFTEQFEDMELSEQVDVPFSSADVKVGVAQSIALKEEERGRGVSEWLLNYGTSLLFDKEKVEAVLVPAWMKDGKIPAENHLVKCGYRMLQVVKKPWASCEELRCHVCGTVPCSCDGAVYIRRKSEVRG